MLVQQRDALLCARNDVAVADTSAMDLETCVDMGAVLLLLFFASQD